MTSRHDRRLTKHHPLGKQVEDLHGVMKVDAEVLKCTLSRTAQGCRLPTQRSHRLHRCRLLVAVVDREIEASSGSAPEVVKTGQWLGASSAISDVSSSSSRSISWYTSSMSASSPLSWSSLRTAMSSGQQVFTLFNGEVALLRTRLPEIRHLARQTCNVRIAFRTGFIALVAPLALLTKGCPGLVPICAPLLFVELADTFFAQRGVTPGVEWHVLCVTFVDHVLVQAAAGCRVAITSHSGSAGHRCKCATVASAFRVEFATVCNKTGC